VDREFYVMQGDFYTPGKFGEEGLQAFDQDKAVDERPSYVVFNGSVGSLVGDNALKANVGEKVRIFFGNGGPNLVSSFHVIGEIFDSVYTEGGTAPSHNVQTTLVPAGGATIVEFGLDVPGTFILVDHSIFRAFNKGALGMLKVDGPANLLTYSGKEVDAVYFGDAVASANDTVDKLQARRKEAIASDPKIAGLGKDIQIEKGKRVFLQTCFACHQANGQGLPGVFPPLAKSDYLMADKDRSIHGVLKGLSGPITVNGKPFNGVMPPVTLSDEQVANVLTYVRNSWGNEGDAVTVDDVRRVKGDASH
jgi:nitrite reductase (NO-forming)